MAIDGQVCFHRRLFADPVKHWRCTIGPVVPLGGTNRDVCGAKLLPTSLSACQVSHVCSYHLLNTQHCCQCPSGRFNPPPAAHPLIRAIRDITVAVKKVAKNPAVLAS